MKKESYVIGIYLSPYGRATVKCKLFCEAFYNNEISVK